MIVSQAYTLKQALLVYVQHLYWLSNPQNACERIGILSCRDEDLEGKMSSTCIQVRFISVYISNHYNASRIQWDNWEFVVPHKSHKYSKWRDVSYKVDTDTMFFKYE